MWWLAWEKICLHLWLYLDRMKNGLRQNTLVLVEHGQVTTQNLLFPAENFLLLLKLLPNRWKVRMQTAHQVHCVPGPPSLIAEVWRRRETYWVGSSFLANIILRYVYRGWQQSWRVYFLSTGCFETHFLLPRFLVLHLMTKTARLGRFDCFNRLCTFLFYFFKCSLLLLDCEL